MKNQSQSPNFIRGTKDSELQRANVKLKEQVEYLKSQMLNNSFHTQSFKSFTNEGDMSRDSKDNTLRNIISRMTYDDRKYSNNARVDTDLSIESTKSAGYQVKGDKLHSNSPGPSNQRYEKPFVLNTGNGTNNDHKREEELIKKYSTIIEHLQSELGKKVSQIAILEERLARYENPRGGTKPNESFSTTNSNGTVKNGRTHY